MGRAIAKISCVLQIQIFEILYQSISFEIQRELTITAPQALKSKNNNNNKSKEKKRDVYILNHVIYNITCVISISTK